MMVRPMAGRPPACSSTSCLPDEIHDSNSEAYLTGVHPVTAGRCAEKGEKLVDKYEGIWEILE